MCAGSNPAEGAHGVAGGGTFKDPTTQPPPKPPLRLIRVVYVLANEGYGGLALWLVRRGRALLPWHGVGVMGETGQIEVRYAEEIERRGAHRPVFLSGETTPFFYERVGS